MEWYNGVESERVAVSVQCVGESWECGEGRGNDVFVEFCGQRERGLISGKYPAVPFWRTLHTGIMHPTW